MIDGRGRYELFLVHSSGSQVTSTLLTFLISEETPAADDLSNLRGAV